jgi:carbon-monoxide dehydrogenase large subunit
MPPVTLVEHVTPNPNVPLGTKGAGESGCLGTPPAVANAVFDALAGHDRSTLDMPLTPAAIWACLQRPTPA